HASILQTGHAVLPLLNAAYLTPERLAELDELADAFLVNPIANRASRVQGRTLVSTAARVWPSEETLALRDSATRLCAHVAPISGVTFRLIGLSLDTAQRITLFAAARGVLTAAVRLGLAGSYEAQRLQHACGDWLDVVAAQCR